MKKIVKIQSISDIITNSSSEVFIMEHSLARSLENDYNTDCISVDDITYEKMLEDNWNYEIYTEMLVKLGIVTWAECNYNNSSRAYTENRKIFQDVLKANEEKIRKALTDNQYAWVDVEDHFTEWENASDDAHDYCITSESRH
jgi:hypothetical protein